MRNTSSSVILVAMLVTLTAAIGNDDPLPKDAERLIKEFEDEVEAIEFKADAEIRAKQQKLTEQLQALRDSLIKDGSLDEALEIHQVVKQMKAVFVEVKFNENWYPAQLLETREEECLIKFDGNDQRQSVPRDDVRRPHHRRPTLKGERPARAMIQIRPREIPKDEKEKEGAEEKK